MLYVFISVLLALAPITLHVDASVVMSDDYTLHATLRIPPNEDNTGMQLVWESEDATSGSSYEQIEPNTRRSIYTFSPRFIPGTYRIWGVLLQKNGQRVTTPKETLQVIRVTPEY